MMWPHFSSNSQPGSSLSILTTSFGSYASGFCSGMGVFLCEGQADQYVPVFLRQSLSVPPVLDRGVWPIRFDQRTNAFARDDGLRIRSDGDEQRRTIRDM